MDASQPNNHGFETTAGPQKAFDYLPDSIPIVMLLNVHAL